MGNDTTVTHGSLQLPAVTVAAYNSEIRAGKGYVGDRASRKAFWALLDELRQRLREVSEDPLGDKPTEDLSKKKLDKTLLSGDPEAAGVVHGAIEAFAAELAKVTARFIKLKPWRGVSRIVVGGGFRASRVGELAIGRASVLMKDAGLEVQLRPIRHDPDEAGLIGAVHLVPHWMLAGHDAIVAIDIGGSNIRAGLVALESKRKPDLAETKVATSELWRYVEDERRPTREDLIQRMGDMVGGLIAAADERDLVLAPFVAIACPGVVAADGSIQRGAQNLPGNWESSRFNLVAALRQHVPKNGDDLTIVVHNDAVVQGLSELPWMHDVERWGVLTIGTGLGNAAFINQDGKSDAEE